MCGLPPPPGPKTCQGLPKSAPARTPAGPRPPGCHPHRSPEKINLGRTEAAAAKSQTLKIKSEKSGWGADSALPWVPRPSAAAPMAVKGRGLPAGPQTEAWLVFSPGEGGQTGLHPKSKSQVARRHRDREHTQVAHCAPALSRPALDQRGRNSRGKPGPRPGPGLPRRLARRPQPLHIREQSMEAQRARKSGSWERRTGRRPPRWVRGVVGGASALPRPPDAGEGEGRERGGAQRWRQQLPWRSDCSRTPSISAMMTRSARPSWSAL